MAINRRTFLKAVFAAAVAPASVVRGLYSPKRWAGYTYGYTGITEDFIEKFRAAVRNTVWQPPIPPPKEGDKIFFKGVELEYEPNFDYDDKVLYIADPPKRRP